MGAGSSISPVLKQRRGFAPLKEGEEEGKNVPSCHFPPSGNDVPNFGTMSSIAYQLNCSSLVPFPFITCFFILFSSSSFRSFRTLRCRLFLDKCYTI
ncbi:hypothetical protein CEXT_228561 [Caerostris extrusa]|uniref:Uncharacterized protein n=1 Tax=Caerostris extrusa TaxID=172846 RepID=A0AAV4NAJ7_CAEEX|nr:hypothetical protein CEXT_228561 [Caerostris extrusa]